MESVTIDHWQKLKKIGNFWRKIQRHMKQLGVLSLIQNFLAPYIVMLILGMKISNNIHLFSKRKDLVINTIHVLSCKQFTPKSSQTNYHNDFNSSLNHCRAFIYKLLQLYCTLTNRHTGKLECFNSMLLKYALKRTGFQ